MIDADFDAIWDCIDSANAMTSSDDRALALEDAIVQLQQLIDAGDKSGWYPLGYAYYCHPRRRAPGSIEAKGMVDALSTAIMNGVEVSLSQLYLAFHFYDLKDYEQAEVHAGLVNERDLDETMAIRLNELRLCVEISRKGISKSLNAINGYATYIQSLREPAIPPLLLLDVLEREVRGIDIDDPVVQALKQLDDAYPVLGRNGVTRLIAE